MCYAYWSLLLSALSLCQLRVVLYSVKPKQRFSTHWFHPLKGFKFSPPYKAYHTLEYMLLDISYLPDLSGMVWQMMFEIRALPVSLVNVVKYSAMFSLHPEKILVPFRRFEHVDVDLVDPLLSSQEFTYLFTCIAGWQQLPAFSQAEQTYYVVVPELQLGKRWV